MSAILTRPATSTPSASVNAFFMYPIVSVSSARTQGVRAIPLSDSPLGTSQETTYAPFELIKAISAAASPSGVRESPVPRTQSTTRAYRRRGILPRTSPLYLILARAQSLENFSARQRICVALPRSAKSRAAINPSPPLLPPPQTKSASSASTAFIAASTVSASASPARSMKTRAGVPCITALLSASCDCL